MYSTSQLQDEVIRLQIRISELERENSELKQPTSKVESPKLDNEIPTAVPMPPPAPPSGGPPPPPPPMAKILRQPQVRKPKKKLRGLFWTKLRRPAGSKTSHSLWDQVEQMGPAVFLDDQLCRALEQEYCILERSHSLSKAKRSSRESRYIEVLDSKRSTNLSIQMSGLPPNWLQALEQLDMAVFPEEQIEQLKLALPSKEDLGDIETAQGNWPDRELGAAEKFLFTLSTVTWAEERLMCWSFLLRCHGNADNIRKRCDLIRSATFELRLKPNLAQLMNLLLATGNYMNSGSGRGDAYGFSYAILPGLADVKNNAKTSNLLKLVSEQVAERHLLEDDDNTKGFEILVAASKFQLSELESNVAQDLAEHATCMRMQDYVASRDPESPVVQVFRPLLEEFSDTLYSLKRDVTACRSEFNELLGWLGMNVAEMSTISSSDIFSIWSNFLISIVN